MEWWPVLIFHRGGLRIKVINNNLSRLRYHSESGLLIYEPKAGQEVDDGEPIDPLEFIARVLIHIQGSLFV